MTFHKHAVLTAALITLSSCTSTDNTTATSTSTDTRTAPNPVEPPFVKKIDEIFAPFTTGNVPGCSVGVSHKNHPVYEKGYGIANLDYNIANTKASSFRIASVSKQFTATSIAILAEETPGFSMTDPLSKYFPQFPAYAEKITIQDLVNHTSGLRDYLVLADLSGWEYNFSRDEALNLLYDQKALNFAPGTRFTYTNSGYLLMEKLVEIVTKNTNLRHYAKEKIFKPLGMKHTFFNDNQNTVVHDRSTGYSPVQGGAFDIHMASLNIIGDGGMYSTVQDMALWGSNVIKNKLGINKEQLGIQLNTPGRLNDGTVLEYAFGKFVSKYKQWDTLIHSGVFVGYRTYLEVIPELDASVSLFCNRSDVNTEDLVEQVTSVFLGHEVPPPLPDLPVSAAHMQRYSGSYWNDVDKMANEIVVDNGRLAYQFMPNYREKMVKTESGKFVVTTARRQPTVTFTAKQYDNFTLTQANGFKTHFSRFERQSLTPEQLKQYVGHFYSEELNAHYQVLVKDGDLVFYIASRRDPLVLRSEVPNAFSSPIGSLLFECDGDKLSFSVYTPQAAGIKFVIDEGHGFSGRKGCNLPR